MFEKVMMMRMMMMMDVKVLVMAVKMLLKDNEVFR